LRATIESFAVFGNLSPQDVAKLGVEVGHAIERASQIGEVQWGPEGAKGWKDIYEALSEAKPGLAGALSARAEAQVVRLAMVYALFDGSTLIGRGHLLAAMAVQDYCEASVRYVFGEKLGNSIADTILSALGHAYPDGLTRTEIHGLFDRHASAGSITTALQDLMSLGRAAMTRRSTNARGRPTEIWTLRR
jgi:hypothetical protein